MSLSLNEVEALAKKATRGVGHPWGIAEESARAIRWLCSQGMDGCAELAALLTVIDEEGLFNRMPVPGKVWTSTSGALCPVATGAALSDHAGGETAVQLENVLRPLLLAPFVAMTAIHRKAPLTLAWENAEVSTDGVTLFVNGDTRTERANVTVTVGMGQGKPQHPATRAEPDQATLATLDFFAHRTYAPATEESRRSGAGAGLSDND